jgi:Zn finger protein HypA/HybF involved in hydrogenase expression
MHELGIARNIVSIVSEAAKGLPVRRVTLEVGKLSGVMASAIAFCFEAVAQGTPLEGSILDIGARAAPSAMPNSRRPPFIPRALAARAIRCGLPARNSTSKPWIWRQPDVW